MRAASAWCTSTLTSSATLCSSTALTTSSTALISPTATPTGRCPALLSASSCAYALDWRETCGFALFVLFASKSFTSVFVSVSS
jgi:hypothetical protein